MWDMGFAHAKGYAEHFGNLDVPINYVCEDGYALGGWLLRQRSNADIAEKRKKMLDSIGMVWARRKAIGGMSIMKQYANIMRNTEI